MEVVALCNLFPLQPEACSRKKTEATKHFGIPATAWKNRPDHAAQRFRFSLPFPPYLGISFSRVQPLSRALVSGRRVGFFPAGRPRGPARSFCFVFARIISAASTGTMHTYYIGTYIAVRREVGR